MDPKKVSAEWFRTTVFREEPIRPRAPRSTERAPAMIRAARSLENGPYQHWQSREAVFMKQGKLLAGYEDDYDDPGPVTCYYPTYQSLTDRQLRAYFSWRTGLRKGDVRKTSLSFAFLYIYELLNQIGVADPMDGYRRLEGFRDAYGQLDGAILPYVKRWLTDYVVYYELDGALLADAPQVVLDRSVAVLDDIQAQDPAQVMHAVKQLSKWLGRSRFYAACPEDMDTAIVRVLGKMSAHCAARCKKTLVEQYFGSLGQCPVQLFDAAVFCDPLKRKSCRYAVDEQRVYSCKNGCWSVWKRTAPPNSGGKLDALLKTIDSVMRQEYGFHSPVKAELHTKWILRLIQEEVRGLLAQKQAAEAHKLSIDFTQLTRIRRDASLTQEKLIVDEELDLPEEPAPATPEQAQPAPADAPGSAGDPLLSPAEHRLLHCLLYGGDTGWVQSEGHLLSVLVDGINEKLYDTFLDCVLDDTPQPIEDHITDLKEMVHL